MLRVVVAARSGAHCSSEIRLGKIKQNILIPASCNSSLPTFDFSALIYSPRQASFVELPSDLKITPKQFASCCLALGGLQVLTAYALLWLVAGQGSVQ